MALSEIDRSLLKRCIERRPRAWEDFVDRFLGLAAHVVNHTAQSRSIRLTLQDTEDLVAEVFLAVVANDFAILRRFRGQSSLATYLTVVARRIVVRELLRRKPTSSLNEVAERSLDAESRAHEPRAHQPGPHEQRIHDREEVERLLSQLRGPEADVIRMYHLEGKTYQEISTSVGMPENSIGPTLSRARAKLREAAR